MTVQRARRRYRQVRRHEPGAVAPALDVGAADDDVLVGALEVLWAEVDADVVRAGAVLLAAVGAGARLGAGLDAPAATDRAPAAETGVDAGVPAFPTAAFPTAA